MNAIGIAQNITKLRERIHPKALPNNRDEEGSITIYEFLSSPEKAIYTLFSV